ncbi:MAG: alpha/beta hydrolase fold protein [Pseudonocardiales bacterium]|nr:alpha/beta hydrolase fold protein [Jatrophihabitantaceae bacterium]MCW2604368.1 alpha/beta hydrolase fold protein [Pseudonocardiales bacterium]
MSDTAPVLLVHGLASNFEHNWRVPGWVDLLEAEGRQVIGVDLPGHGAHPVDPASVDSVEHVAAAISAYDRVDAVGFSAGSSILLRVAAKDPDRFGKLVTIGVGNSIVEPVDPDAGPSVATRFLDGSGDVLSQLFLRMLKTAGNDLEQVRSFVEHGGLSRRETLDLSRITCPSLVVIGDKDFAAPADKLAAALPNSALVNLRGVDHFSAVNDFACIDAVLRFLAA